MEVVVDIGALDKKSIKVGFLPHSVKVHKGGVLSLELSLFAHIDPDGCTWTLEKAGDATNLVITLEKCEPVSWPRIAKPAE